MQFYLQTRVNIVSLRIEIRFCCPNLKILAAVGFEPTPPKRLVP